MQSGNTIECSLGKMRAENDYFLPVNQFRKRYTEKVSM